MTMEEQYKAFVVIKILNQSNADLDQYVCVPSTWIKVKDFHNGNVVFGYPSEPRVVTITRVIEYQPLDKTWPSLYGEVVHNTDSQADAYKVLRSKNLSHENETENQSNKSTPENNKTKTTPEQEKHSSKKNKRKHSESDDDVMTQNIFQAKSKKIGNVIDEKFELQISKLFEMIRSRKVTLESNDDRSESPVSSSSLEEEESETEECESISNDREKAVTAQKAANIEDTDTARRSARTRYPDGYFRIENDIDNPSDLDYVCPGSELNSKNISSLNIGRSKRKVSESARSNKSEPSDINENDYVDTSEINLSIMNDEVYEQCNNFCNEFNESFQRTMSILDNTANYFQKVISEHKESLKVSKKKSRDIKKRSKKNSESESSLLDTSHYNTEDTKWTLKHPEPGLGLVELMPHTGVYVSEEVLIQSQNTFKEATKFARALLEDIFKKEALNVCSFTGCPPKRGKKYTLQGRPGLDVNARQTLISYATEYGTEKNMRYADVVSITNSIKNKLQKYHLSCST